MTSNTACPYNNCSLRRRHGTEACPNLNYEDCEVYQTYLEEEQMLVQRIGITTDKWERGWLEEHIGL